MMTPMTYSIISKGSGLGKQEEEVIFVILEILF